MEADHMPGVWSRVLGNTTPPEYQTVRSNTKSAVYFLCTEERSKLMEIKYADNVTLTVEITDQMVKDYRKCGKLVNESDGFAPCDSCSNNIDIMDVGLCDIPEVREELERRAKK